MARPTTRHSRIEASSGNVFADLRLPNAAEVDTKVRLAVLINRLTAARRLSRASAAKRLEASERTVSVLENYRLDGLSVGRLMNLLLKLGQDVEIRIKPRRAVRSRGKIVVHAALLSPRRRHLADVLGAMPNVGEDGDFVRQQSDRRRP
jgi:predicted XRE-type DNA-binding protein